ncbi:MAG: glycosyltransferase N-terminal domain-containing protein [Pseudomonadota bacterium]
MADPLSLRAYLAAGYALRPLVDRHLERRTKRGKEDPERVDEKRGVPTLPHPGKPVIWCHAVGVGEALALTGFAECLIQLAPDHAILITTSSRNAAEVLMRNAPEGIIHQYLPVDVPPYVARFLDHWQPVLSIWAERDIWPRLIWETAQHGIPQVIVNGRMTKDSLKQKRRATRLFAACYGRCTFIDVQDQASAKHFAELAPHQTITVGGSLKAYGPPLKDHPEARSAWAKALGSKTWLAASVHPGEFDAILSTQAQLAKAGWRAIFAPRSPADADALRALCAQKGFSTKRTSSDAPSGADIVIEDRLGYLGLWFRLADAAFIGGSFDTTGGHNPYEPARLACPFFHGPNVSNFSGDYARFSDAGLNLRVQTAGDLAKAIATQDLNALGKQVQSLSNTGETAVQNLAQRCVALVTP